MPTQICPAALRGGNYPDRFTTGCPSFHKCNICGKCRNYNGCLMMCLWCEQGKMQRVICKHTDEQQLSAAIITRVLRRPMFDPNDEGEQRPVDVSNDDSWDANADILREAAAKGYGRIGKVTEGG